MKVQLIKTSEEDGIIKFFFESDADRQALKGFQRIAVNQLPLEKVDSLREGDYRTPMEIGSCKEYGWIKASFIGLTMDETQEISAFTRQIYHHPGLAGSFITASLFAPIRLLASAKK